MEDLATVVDQHLTCQAMLAMQKDGQLLPKKETAVLVQQACSVLFIGSQQGFRCLLITGKVPGLAFCLAA